uniref:NADH dehydrogenase subunit 6 n=1 Tax=Knipowitschia caucasica TaxID=637954 RepID=A0AAV2KIQ2_KNICA
MLFGGFVLGFGVVVGCVGGVGVFVVGVWWWGGWLCWGIVLLLGWVVWLCGVSGFFWIYGGGGFFCCVCLGLWVVVGFGGEVCGYWVGSLEGGWGCCGVFFGVGYV